MDVAALCVLAGPTTGAVLCPKADVAAAAANAIIKLNAAACHGTLFQLPQEGIANTRKLSTLLHALRAYSSQDTPRLKIEATFSAAGGP
jgi:hypothetical protein